MLLIHIAIALVGLTWSAVAFIKPSLAKLHVSYALMYGVLITGVGLVLLNHSAMVQACTTGLAYFAASITITVFTRRKLAIQLTK